MDVDTVLRIADGKKLKVLGLDKTNASDDGQWLQFTNVEGLFLAHTKITDEGFLKLKQLKTLKTIIVTKTVVSDAAVESFQESLPNCEILHKLPESEL